MGLKNLFKKPTTTLKALLDRYDYLNSHFVELFS